MYIIFLYIWWCGVWGGC